MYTVLNVVVMFIARAYCIYVRISNSQMTHIHVLFNMSIYVANGAIVDVQNVTVNTYISSHNGC